LIVGSNEAVQPRNALQELTKHHWGDTGWKTLKGLRSCRSAWLEMGISKQPVCFGFQRQQRWILEILAIYPRRALLHQFRIHIYSAVLHPAHGAPVAVGILHYPRPFSSGG
jgi:hypothetical protein